MLRPRIRIRISVERFIPARVAFTSMLLSAGQSPVLSTVNCQFLWIGQQRASVTANTAMKPTSVEAQVAL